MSFVRVFIAIVLVLVLDGVSFSIVVPISSLWTSEWIFNTRFMRKILFRRSGAIINDIYYTWMFSTLFQCNLQLNQKSLFFIAFIFPLHTWNFCFPTCLPDPTRPSNNIQHFQLYILLISFLTIHPSIHPLMINNYFNQFYQSTHQPQYKHILFPFIK